MATKKKAVAPKPMTRAQRAISLQSILTLLLTIGPIVQMIFPQIKQAIAELKKLIEDLKNQPGE